jgi:hypothetical protein
MENKPISKLERFSEIGDFLFITLSAPAYLGNEIIQQIKHGYYHLTKKEHKVVERGDLDPDCFFDSFKTYVPKETYIEGFN